jgi:hypothetical protein
MKGDERLGLVARIVTMDNSYRKLAGFYLGDIRVPITVAARSEA